MYCQVADEGQGITEDKLGVVFNSFDRAGRKPGKGGIGLGLALVKMVVERHGGDVEVESEQGQGSRFTLVLPVIDEARLLEE